MMELKSTDIAEKVAGLKVGDRVLLSGTIYTARDAAHKRIVELMAKKEKLPFELKNSIIYYCGPAPAKPGNIVGSCGPTTSARMDMYTPLLFSMGVKATIGKGKRSAEIAKAAKKHKAVYFAVTGGVGALLSQKVRMQELVAFKELGPEAVYKFVVLDFPLIVAVDSNGNSIFED
jgi:fumarate hydratase subunit beta